MLTTILLLFVLLVLLLAWIELRYWRDIAKAEEKYANTVSKLLDEAHARNLTLLDKWQQTIYLLKGNG